MPKLKALALTVSILSLGTTALAQVSKQTPAGFSALFNGKNLDGWWGLKTEDPAKWMALPKAKFESKVAKSVENIHKHWRTEGGILINDGKGMFLSTMKNYSDFELRVDYRTVAQADSGIYLRGIPQVQIWDYTKEGGKWNIGADKGSGGLWNNSKGANGKDPLVLADRPFGEWNRFRIFMVGERVTIYLNGKLVVDHARLENFFNRKGNLPKAGPIQLQTHGGEIRWRNVFVREIAAEEANALLAAGGTQSANAEFQSIFNGKTLTGWKGPVDNYEVTKDGTVQCRKGKGGTIYWNKEYSDFAARLEIKLPPGGNNGLAIRYPGNGDTAYVGMCELQVLDNTAKKYAKLKVQQYHGSAYGQVAARRGFLRPAGTWNFQEVVVQGSRIKVELNGYVILDADILKDADYMAKRERFRGRTRTHGYFGFAGHGDAVEYRAVRVKDLSKD